MVIILENMDSCVGCSACAQRCPTSCISMVYDDEGFLFPRIDEERCTDCGLCKSLPGPEIRQCRPRPGTNRFSQGLGCLVP